MSAAALLSRLDRVKQTSPSGYSCGCPGPLHARGDRHRSLSVRELDDGRTLVHCHAGCDVQEVLAALGLSLEDLYPPRSLSTTNPYKPVERPWRFQDILRVFDYELTLMAVWMADMSHGLSVTDQDRERAAQCAERILYIISEVQRAA